MAITNVVSNVMDARAVGTPLIAVETPDPGATRQALEAHINSKSKPVPTYIWDVAEGLRPTNTIAEDTFGQMLEPFGGDQLATIQPLAALQCLKKAPKFSFVLMANMQRFWSEQTYDPSVVQAVWNLRNWFKTSGRTLVFTVPSCTLPAELQNDVVVFTEELPTSDELRPMIEKLHKGTADSLEKQSDGKLTFKQPDDSFMQQAVDSLSGLAMQQAEQVTSMAILKGHQSEKDNDGKNCGDTMDLDTLRHQQRQQIEQTPGLQIFDGQNNFDDIKGLDSLTGFLRSVINGKRKPKAFIFIDEIEKMFAGATGQGGGDSSGTSQEQLGYILQHLEDTQSRGCICVGPPGTGKSELAKSAGNEADCWTVSLDLGGMKGSLVGESGERTRRALCVVEALAQGGAFWIATCNSIESLPPELRRRFSYGTWFVDLPTAEARKALWKHYGNKFGVKPTKLEDEGWTGAEIKTCCSMASDMNMSVKEASGFISPVSRSNAESISKLRRLATGRFRSASDGEFYKAPSQKPSKKSSTVSGDDEMLTRIVDMNES